MISWDKTIKLFSYDRMGYNYGIKLYNYLEIWKNVQETKGFTLIEMKWLLPLCSMYGIFTIICPKNRPNVGTYTIHGAYGLL